MVFLIFVKTLNDKIMKKQLYFTTVLLLTILFYSSCKKWPDENNIRNTYSVNQADLPIIIPYTDTSKVRFLKNGTDTLTFTSQGLKSIYTIEGFADGECAGKNKVQQVSLRMKYNDDEFFEITEKADSKISYYVNNQDMYDEIYTTFYSYGNLSTEFLDSILINGYKYDSIYKIKNSYGSYIILKEKIGILQYKLNNITYTKLSY